MIDFQFDIPTTSLVFFCVAVFLFLPLIFIYLRPLWRVRNAIHRQENDRTMPRMDAPVSIIVYAAGEADSLQNLLPSLLNQRYDAPYEVIVVNEGESDSTSDVVERLQLSYPNLYLTYTPDGAHQLSRKKLALMIGIKAARYPIVIQTVASAAINSNMWLARMTEPFANPSIEVVLGSGVMDMSADKGMGRLCRLFNSAADDMVWMSAALDGFPYRGTELNLAYTRDIFFRNRGFSRSLNIKFGDDDIFVNEIATRRNTAVVLHPESQVKRETWNTRRVYRELRARYSFTGKRTSHIARWLHALGGWLLWMVIVLSIFGAVTMWPNVLGAVIGVVLVSMAVVLSATLWNKAILAITGENLGGKVVWLMLGRPFANLYNGIKSTVNNKNQYTWIK